MRDGLTDGGSGVGVAVARTNYAEVFPLVDEIVADITSLEVGWCIFEVPAPLVQFQPSAGRPYISHQID